MTRDGPEPGRDTADASEPVTNSELADAYADDTGGDPACWLARVCPECGRLTEDRDSTRCTACGEPLP